MAVKKQRMERILARKNMKTDPLIKDWIAARNEVFRSCSRQKIEAWCKENGVEIPENDEVFWRGVHKIICNTPSIPAEEREASRQWLLARGSSPDIGPGI